MTCTSCGAENRDGRKFCANCGSALAIACPSCGAPNEPGDRFCGECGSPLGVGAAAGSREPTPEVPWTSDSERRLVSVLFTDLVGFTALSEARDAEDVRDLLTRYFEAARRIVERYGGTIEKFIGDAVMAVWGSPVAREDDAERAVRAGLDLVAAVRAIGVDEGLGSLAARSGVATGEAAVNRAAEGQGMVIGDLVNTASRVQSTAGSGQVFVTEATKRASDAAIAYGEAGHHELKGKAEALPLFQATRVVAGRGGAFRSAGLEAPFVGRDRELRLLKDLFHATTDSRAAHLVAVTGIGGVGKSRLSWEFEKYLDGLVGDVYWHRGRCIPYGDGVAYWALAEMVRSRVGAAEEEEPTSTLAKLRTWLERWCPDADERRWLEAGLAQLLALADRESSPREELFSAWRRFFDLLATSGPVVVLFEDLQWADSGLLDFIDDLLVRSAEIPIYVVGLARPEIAERHPGWGTGRSARTSMVLGPLRDDDIRQMLRGMVPGLPDDLVERVRERAEGIPLYAVETVRMLLDRGIVRRTGDGVELTSEVSATELDVPETLQALIGARLDDLPPEERSLLQHAAILGKTFTATALAAVTGQAQDALSPLLERLKERELLAVEEDPTSPDRGQFGFLQSIVQRVVYDTVSRRDRKTRHLALARHLEESWAGDEDDIAEVVAAHYVEAYEAEPNDPDAGEIRDAASTALDRAGRRALSLAAAAEAVTYFDRAAEMAADELGRIRLREAAANAAAVGGDRVAAISRFDAVIDEYDRIDRPLDSARARARVADALWSVERLEDALARMEDAYAALAEASGPEIAALGAQLGRIRYFSAKDADAVRQALEPVDRALEISEASRLGEILSDAMNTKSLILGSLERPEEALALLQHSLDIALEHDATPATIRAYANLSNEMIERDRFDEAFDYEDRGRAFAELTGYRYDWWFLTGHVASVYLSTGRWDDLEALWREFDTRRNEPGSVAGAPGLDFAWIFVQGRGRGDIDEAVRLAERQRQWESSDDFQARAFVDVQFAQVALMLGRPEESLERTARVMSGRAALGVRHWLFKAAFEEALEAALAAPDLDRAAAVLEDVASIPLGERTPSLDAAAAGFEAMVAARREGDPERIDARFREATGLCREIGRPFWQARFLLGHAEWLATTERSGEALVVAADAAGIFRSLRADPWLERAERLAPASLKA